MAEFSPNNYADAPMNLIPFGDRGSSEGTVVVCRPRFAEMLITAVYNPVKEVIHDMGCRLEHLFLKGVEKRPRAFAGNSTILPHGKPVPRKRHRVRSEERASRVVYALRDLKAGDRGTIAYLETNDAGRLNRLMAMGALPGISVTVIQRFPSYVFQMGRSQFAVDREMAEGIFVRIKEGRSCHRV